MDVICVGDVMLDVHVAAGALAHEGDVHGRVHVMPGGTSANAAVWATWTGASAGVLGAVGVDTAGRLVMSALAERGVDVLGLVREEEPTGTMLVVIDGGDRSMVADRGASAALRDHHLPPRLEAAAVLVSGYLLLQEPTTATAVAALDRASGSYRAVETASWPLLSAFGAGRFFEATTLASVLLANAEEARALTGKGPFEAAAHLGERYRIAVVKSGADGAVVAVDGVVEEHRSPVVDEIDPSGAGDAFDGVFLGLLARGATEREAADAGCRAGALVASSVSVWPERDAE